MSRLEAIRKKVSTYVTKTFPKSPLGLFLPHCSIVVTEVDSGIVWDILVLMADSLFSQFSQEHGESFVLDDHAHTPPIFTKVRSYSWFMKDLTSRRAIALWIYGNGLIIEDPESIFESAIRKEREVFESTIPDIIKIKYLELRTERHNLRSIVETKRAMALHIVRANIVKLALELCLLAEKKPYPYKKWLPDVARDQSIAGQKVYALAQSFLNEEDYGQIIAISEDLIAEVINFLTKSEMCTKNYLERWWLHLG